MSNDNVALSIIIVNWKSKEFLRACLASVYSNTQRLAFETLVIDNASFDGCSEMLAQQFPAVRFIQSYENLGFSRANNRAFEQSRGEVVLFLNPDTELVGPAINYLFDSLIALPNAGAVGARLLNTDGTVQVNCIQAFPTILNQILDSEFLRRLLPRLWLWGMAPLFSRSTEPSEVQAIVGACIMLKRAVFEEVQGFDPGYFMYAEDIDLSFKVQQAGFKSYFIPRATLKHYGGGSSQSARSHFSSVMMRESVYRFFRVRRGLLTALAFRISLSVAALVRLPLAAASSLLNRHPLVTTPGSTGKWFAILRWTLGLETWTKHKTAA